MADKMFLFVGSLTHAAPYFPDARGQGISVFAFNPDTGESRQASLTDGIDNPTYLSFDPRRSCVYANSEVSAGMVTAYRFDPASGRLNPINVRSTLGSTPAHNSLSRDGRFLLVANYEDEPADAPPGQSIAVFPVRDDGGIGAPCGSSIHRGSGPNKARQDRPHAHCAVASPDDRFAIVADLGTDALVAHRLGADGALSAVSGPFHLPPGAGPRHFVFHPTHPYGYAINELNSTICALGYDGAGHFSPIETVPTVPATVSEANYPADLHLAPDGRFLYGSNRGHDSIVIYALDDATGRLALVGHQPCGGKMPRNFAIDPLGRWLLVANQGSDSIAVFRIDPQSASLTDSGRRLEVGTPMCVKFSAR